VIIVIPAYIKFAVSKPLALEGYQQNWSVKW